MCVLRLPACNWLRSWVKQLERGEASVVDLKQNLECAATVLEWVCIDETRRLLDSEDELSGIQSDSVPSEVQDWLASAVTRQMGMMLKRTEEKPRFRSIVHAVQAGIFVERMYRRTSNTVGLSYPPAVMGVLKIPIPALVSFVEALEVGSSKHKNPYHDLMHAADGTQTVHQLLFKTGRVEVDPPPWALREVDPPPWALQEVDPPPWALQEVDPPPWALQGLPLASICKFRLPFPNIFSYEKVALLLLRSCSMCLLPPQLHNWSDSAMLYNDRSVLENHHVSAAYRLLQDDEEMNILSNLSKDDWRRLLDAEDELSGIQSDSVPSEVQDWLASAVTRQMGMMLKRIEEKPRFRSIVHAVQAGIFVERIHITRALQILTIIPVVNNGSSVVA
ncbi:UNVERIFIED_CONTAM: hypothetical protein H355_005908 [Colinus virginianus]|nr:hypothetical protein H355_005908 [Colinus virginianus]